MHGRGYYGNPYGRYPFARSYAHRYAYLGQDPSIALPHPASGMPMVPPMHPMSTTIEHSMPMQEVEHHIKVKPAAVHLSTGGFFQVALAVTLGLVGAGAIAGAAGAAAAVHYKREKRAANGG